MSTLRKILFYLFLTAYLIVCPLIILYALGITFQPQTQSLRKTGLIFVDTFPAGATVYIDRHRFPHKTPTVIEGLPVGEYRVKLHLNGYLPWEKILPVEENKATAAENILLVPQKWLTRPIVAYPFEGLFPVPELGFLLYAQDKLLKSFHLLKENQINPWNALLKPLNQTLVPLINSDPSFRDTRIEKLYLEENSPLIILETKETGKKFMTLNLNHPAESLEDVTAILPPQIDALLWESGDENTIFAQAKDVLYRVDLDSRTVSPHIVQDIQNSCIFRGKIYVLTKEHSIKRFNKNGTEEEILLPDAELGETLFGRYKDLRMFVFDEDIFIFWAQNGALFSNRLPYLVIEEGIRGFKFDPRKKRLLVWSKNDLGFLDFAKNMEESVFEHGPLLVWLPIQARNIKQAAWINDGAQILYQDQNTVYLTDTESFQQPVVYKVIEIKPNSSIYYSQERGIILYLAPRTGYLSMLILKAGV